MNEAEQLTRAPEAAEEVEEENQDTQSGPPRTFSVERVSTHVPAKMLSLGMRQRK